MELLAYHPLDAESVEARLEADVITRFGSDVQMIEEVPTKALELLKKNEEGVKWIDWHYVGRC